MKTAVFVLLLCSGTALANMAPGSWMDDSAPKKEEAPKSSIIDKDGKEVTTLVPQPAPEPVKVPPAAIVFAVAASVGTVIWGGRRARRLLAAH